MQIIAAGTGRQALSRMKPFRPPTGKKVVDVTPLFCFN
jgi:hypothetical protein